MVYYSELLNNWKEWYNKIVLSLLGKEWKTAGQIAREWNQPRYDNYCLLTCKQLEKYGLLESRESDDPRPRAKDWRIKLDVFVDLFYSYQLNLINKLKKDTNIGETMLNKKDKQNIINLLSAQFIYVPLFNAKIGAQNFEKMNVFGYLVLCFSMFVLNMKVLNEKEDTKSILVKNKLYTKKAMQQLYTMAGYPQKEIESLDKLDDSRSLREAEYIIKGLESLERVILNLTYEANPKFKQLLENPDLRKLLSSKKGEK